MAESIFASVVLLFLSIVMLCLACFAWRVSRQLFHIPVVADLIFFFVFIKVALYYLLPTLMRIGSDYKFEREDKVALIDLVKLYSIEFLSWSVWIMVLMLMFGVFSKKKKKLQLREFFQFNYMESKTLLFVLVCGFILNQFFLVTRSETGIFLEIFKSLFYFAGLATGPFLMVISLRYYGKTLFCLGVISSLFSLISLSTRGALVYLILLCLFLVWVFLRDKRSKAIVVGTACAISLIYFVFGGFLSASIIIDESGNVTIDTGVDVHKKGTRTALEEIEWRFGAATRMGTAFLNLHDRGETAGFNPIKHSLMGFLPRSINPNKPVPSTLDAEDIYSMGMYIIYREIHGYNTYSMVEFPTGAHFYWEFGIIGVLVLSAISGLYVAFCAHFFSKLGMVAIPLMVAIFKPWGYVDPKIWVSDIALQIYQIILPIVFLVLIVRIVRYGLKGIMQILYSSNGYACTSRNIDQEKHS